MGAKLSRRKSESAAGAEGVAAETPAAEQPETSEALAATEGDEQKPEDAGIEAEPKPIEFDPQNDTALSEPASEPGALETVTQAVENIVSNVTEQIAGPVEDIVNKGLGAVEAMMAAVSIKDDPTEEAAAAPAPAPAPAPALEAKNEPLVDVSAEATPKIDLSILEPPEEPALSSAVEDLLLSQPITEGLLPEPVSAAMVKDVTPEVEESQGLPSHIDTEAPLEIEESLVCLKQDAAPAEPLLNCDVGVDPISLNSDPMISLGDMEQAMSTAVSTVSDLI